MLLYPVHFFSTTQTFLLSTVHSNIYSSFSPTQPFSYLLFILFSFSLTQPSSYPLFILIHIPFFHPLNLLPIHCSFYYIFLLLSRSISLSYSLFILLHVSHSTLCTAHSLSLSPHIFIGEQVSVQQHKGVHTLVWGSAQVVSQVLHHVKVCPHLLRQTSHDAQLRHKVDVPGAAPQVPLLGLGQ